VVIHRQSLNETFPIGKIRISEAFETSGFRITIPQKADVGNFAVFKKFVDVFVLTFIRQIGDVSSKWRLMGNPVLTQIHVQGRPGSSWKDDLFATAISSSTTTIYRVIVIIVNIVGPEKSN
jgi:hypothetical protein